MSQYENDIIARNVRLLMAYQDINVGELAELSGISYDYITGVRTGRVEPGLHTIKPICRSLGVTVDDIENPYLFYWIDQIIENGRKAWNKKGLDDSSA